LFWDARLRIASHILPHFTSDSLDVSQLRYSTFTSCVPMDCVLRVLLILQPETGFAVREWLSRVANSYSHSGTPFPPASRQCYISSNQRVVEFSASGSSLTDVLYLSSGTSAPSRLHGALYGYTVHLDSSHRGYHRCRGLDEDRWTLS
jgi:hypothetical protein